MNATKKFDVIFTATHEWWEIYGSDFATADDCVREALEEVFTGEEAYLADCDEAFACTLTRVAPEHTAIRAGDIVVSDGIGSDKIFLRAE